MQTTIHAAQGVTADTVHGLVTGQESRQQLYTMLTRGRAANHLYLEVVGDGDPHTVIRPETVTPRTPTEFLEQILAHNEAPTALRELSEPAARLHQAVQRYTDGLHAAAEQIVGPRIVDALDRRADQVVPGVTDPPAWPPLRTDLIALSAETDKLTIDPPDPHNSRPLRSNGDNASARASPMSAPTPARLDGPRRQAAARTRQSRQHDHQDHQPHQSEVHHGPPPPSPSR